MLMLWELHREVQFIIAIDFKSNQIANTIIVNYFYKSWRYENCIERCYFQKYTQIALDIINFMESIFSFLQFK